MGHRPAVCSVAISLSILLLAPAAARAQENAPKDWRDDPRAALRLSVEPFAIAGFNTNFNSGGDLSVRRAGWRLAMRQPISRKLVASLNAENEYSFNHFNLPPLLGGGDPIDLLTTVRFLPSLTYIVNDRWTATVTARFAYSAESGAEFGGSLLGGVSFTARRKVNDRLTIGLGVSIMQQLEDTVQVFPFPRLDWRPTEAWRIYTDTINLGVNAERSLGDFWFVKAHARIRPREYRLDNGPGSLLRNGVFRDESILVGVEIAWRPRDGVEAALEVGSIVFQQIELLDATGEEQFDDNANPTVFVSGRLRLRF